MYDKFITEIKKIVQSWGVDFSEKNTVFDSKKVQAINELYSIDVAEKIMNKNSIMRPLLTLSIDTPVTMNDNGEFVLGNNIAGSNP